MLLSQLRSRRAKRQWQKPGLSPDSQFRRTPATGSPEKAVMPPIFGFRAVILQAGVTLGNDIVAPTGLAHGRSRPGAARPPAECARCFRTLPGGPGEGPGPGCGPGSPEFPSVSSTAPLPRRAARAPGRSSAPPPASPLLLPDPRRPLPRRPPGGHVRRAPPRHVAPPRPAPAPARSDVPWNSPAPGEPPAGTRRPRPPLSERPSGSSGRPAAAEPGQEGAAPPREAAGPSLNKNSCIDPQSRNVAKRPF
ncbi:hypothetical protein R6Z07F_012117 [Ovis aries]